MYNKTNSVHISFCFPFPFRINVNALSFEEKIDTKLTNLMLHLMVQFEHLTEAAGLLPQCSCLDGNLLHIAHTRQQQQPSVLNQIISKVSTSI